MLNLLATFFYGLAQIASGMTNVCDSIADYFDADRTPDYQQKTKQIDSKVREDDATRFSRLLWDDEPDSSLTILLLSEERAPYEREAARERIRRANLTRSPISRLKEPLLVEAWVPFGEVRS